MLCIGLTMAVWSPCPLKCPLWGWGELGALQGLLSIQHRQRGASQEVGSVAADALLPRMRADVGQVTEEVVSRAVGRQEEREDIRQAEGALSHLHLGLGDRGVLGTERHQGLQEVLVLHLLDQISKAIGLC